MVTRDDSELAQLGATLAKLNAPTAKLQLEARWPPGIIAAGLVAIIGASLGASVAYHFSLSVTR